jgi:two-component system, NtrC family, sensor kinase
MFFRTRVAKDPHLHVRNAQTSAYTKLLRKFIIVSVACSVLPLLVVGWASHLYYARFSLSRTVANFQREIEYNRKIVQSFLQERISDLKLLAFTHSLGFMADSSNLTEALNMLNDEGYYFTDLGVIDEKGKHMAYVGPHDLMDKDYSQTVWFKEVMTNGACISDIFMGYRKNPHFVMAVVRWKGDSPWILRATINTEFLSSLVDKTRLGQTGEVFLVNRAGVYQTKPRFEGKIMEGAPLSMNSFTGDSGMRITDPNSPVDLFPLQNAIGLIDVLKLALMGSYSQQVVGYSWLRQPEWLLVVKQDSSEVFGDVVRVNMAILVLLHLSMLAILIVSVFTARYMINAIRDRDQEAEKLNSQLMQASKLASIGELAAGVAHEINNPLAVIVTENQVIRDLTEDDQNLDTQFKDQLTQSLSQIDSQVQRCSRITQNLLRFSRRITAAPQDVDLNLALRDVVGLLEKRAHTCGIQVSLDLHESLPALHTDPFGLEQVFLNLINNAIDAIEGEPSGSIHISTRFDSTSNDVVAAVTDTGSGIPADVIERVFDPFFTTKPVGKGTGLGLSISYSIIRQMGGDISVRSEVGKGTEFTVSLPLTAGEQTDILEDSRKEGLDEKASPAIGG